MARGADLVQFFLLHFGRSTGMRLHQALSELGKERVFLLWLSSSSLTGEQGQ
jgi:hypothetical protein